MDATIYLTEIPAGTNLYIESTWAYSGLDEYLYGTLLYATSVATGAVRVAYWPAESGSLDERMVAARAMKARLEGTEPPAAPVRTQPEVTEAPTPAPTETIEDIEDTPETLPSTDSLWTRATCEVCGGPISREDAAMASVPGIHFDCN